MTAIITGSVAAEDISGVLASLTDAAQHASDLLTMDWLAYGDDPFGGPFDASFGDTKIAVSLLNGSNAILTGSNLTALQDGSWMTGLATAVTINRLEVTGPSGSASSMAVTCNIVLNASSESVTLTGTLSSLEATTPYFGLDIDFGNTSFSLYELNADPAGSIELSQNQTNRINIRNIEFWIDEAAGGGASKSGSVTLAGDLYYDMSAETYGGTLSSLHMDFASQYLDITGLSLPFESVASASSTQVLLADILQQAGVDTTVGGSGSDLVIGHDGNDTLEGMGGDDALEGGDGIDTAVYAGNRASYLLATTDAGYTVSGGSEGTDTLADIERLQFANTKVALDLGTDEHAGQAMGLIGVLAPVYLTDPAIRGAILSLFDDGYSMQQLCELALSIGLLPGDSTQLANTVFQNVVGQPATTEWTNLLTGYIDANGAANFVATIAGMAINAQLDMYSQTGLEYF